MFRDINLEDSEIKDNYELDRSWYEASADQQQLYALYTTSETTAGLPLEAQHAMSESLVAEAAEFLQLDNPLREELAVKLEAATDDPVLDALVTQIRGSLGSHKEIPLDPDLKKRIVYEVDEKQPVAEQKKILKRILGCQKERNKQSRREAQGLKKGKVSKTLPIPEAPVDPVLVKEAMEKLGSKTEIVLDHDLAKKFLSKLKELPEAEHLEMLNKLLTRQKERNSKRHVESSKSSYKYVSRKVAEEEYSPIKEKDKRAVERIKRKRACENKSKAHMTEEKGQKRKLSDNDESSKAVENEFEDARSIEPTAKKRKLDADVELSERQSQQEKVAASTPSLARSHFTLHGNPETTFKPELEIASDRMVLDRFG